MQAIARNLIAPANLAEIIQVSCEATLRAKLTALKSAGIMRV